MSDTPVVQVVQPAPGSTPSTATVRPEPAVQDAALFGWIALASLAISIGQILASPEKLTWRVVLGRALISTGLGMSSTAAFLWFPQIPFYVLLGITCGIVSFGTSGVERLFQAIFNRFGSYGQGAK